MKPKAARRAGRVQKRTSATRKRSALNSASSGPLVRLPRGAGRLRLSAAARLPRFNLGPWKGGGALFPTCTRTLEGRRGQDAAGPRSPGDSDRGARRGHFDKRL